MKYSKENLEKYAKQCDTITELAKLIRQSPTVSSSSINHVSKKLKEFNIDTSHFIGSAKTHSNLHHSGKLFSDVLIHDENLKHRISRRTLLRAILSEGSVDYECNICKNNGFHFGKVLLLQIDHMDGNWKNNLITNLRFLCPNCHSQTDTYGYKETKY